MPLDPPRVGTLCARLASAFSVALDYTYAAALRLW
jgi:hypothetical protein